MDLKTSEFWGTILSDHIICIEEKQKRNKSMVFDFDIVGTVARKMVV